MGRYASQRNGDITLLVRDWFAASHFAPVLLDLLMGVLKPAAVAYGNTRYLPRGPPQNVSGSSGVLNTQRTPASIDQSRPNRAFSFPATPTPGQEAHS